VVIPSYISGLAPYCFACSEVCTVTFESDPASPYLLSVGKCAFLGCTALSSIIFPEKMSVIDDRAFEGCSSLWDVEMPKSLYKLGSYAFDGCSPKSLAIPEDLEMLGVNFVDTCTPLDLIYGSHGYELVENLDDVYNCRIFFHYLDSDFEISGKSLISCRSKQRHITLPDNIESIKANAFKNCANLESLYIPDSVMLIGDYALSGCQRLSEVRLPESCFGLGERVFENCPSLKKLHIPKALQYFKRNAFEGSGPFESITCDEDSLRFVMKDGKLVTKGFSYRDHQDPDFELSMLFEDFTLGGEVILAEKGAEEETK
ncbi:MAG: leucine-rich repeat domain-containing protein, partial [Clostridia bacterium]|nr:leucine-rich repeat domain-containing protein [Clostridia bacterium]